MSDGSQFEAFVREYQDMVFATAVRLLANPADAEDVAQTVFLKAYERFREIGQSAEAPGWLKTVTTNLCLNHLTRYRARWRFFSELGRDTEEGATVAFEASLVAETASPAEERLVSRLRDVDINRLTPIDALTLLASLKKDAES